MRVLLIVCLALLASGVAHAMCHASGLGYWPRNNAQLDTRPILLTDGFAADQATIASLRRARLVTPGHTVELKIIARHTGAMRLTQIAWAPKAPLKAGKTYTLELLGAHKTWRPAGYSSDSNSNKKLIQWTVATVSRPAPTWKGPPRLGKSSYAGFGCGPAVFQWATLPVTDAPALVEVSLERAGQTQRYVLPVLETGEVRIGHSMCAGAFDVEGEGEFTARFALLRPDGTRDAAPAGLRFPALGGRTSLR